MFIYARSGRLGRQAREISRIAGAPDFLRSERSRQTVAVVWVVKVLSKSGVVEALSAPLT